MTNGNSMNSVKIAPMPEHDMTSSPKMPEHNTPITTDNGKGMPEKMESGDVDIPVKGIGHYNHKGDSTSIGSYGSSGYYSSSTYGSTIGSYIRNYISANSTDSYGGSSTRKYPRGERIIPISHASFEVSSTSACPLKVRTEAVELQNFMEDSGILLSTSSDLSDHKQVEYLLKHAQEHTSRSIMGKYYSLVFEQWLFVLLSEHGMAEGVLDKVRASYYRGSPYLTLQIYHCHEVDLVFQVLKHNSWLTHLRLFSCEIGDDDCAKLANGLKYTCELTELALSNNFISDDGITALSEVLHSKIKILNFRANHVNDGGIIKLANAIKNFTHLETLDMSFNHINDVGAIALSTHLKNLTSLKQLDLRCNKIGDEGAIAITSTTKDFRWHFKLLIWNHRLTTAGTNTIRGLRSNLDANFHALNINEMLNTDIEDNILATNMECDELHSIHIVEVDGIESKIPKILKNFRNLQTLKIMDYILREDDVKALADGLQHCQKLKGLSLGWNRIDANGVKVLSDCLQQCNGLKILNLESNSIGSNGAKALSEGLMHCCNLQTLNLNSNVIGDEGVEAIAEILQSFNHLQTLNLAENCIGSTGSKALAKGLMHCDSLQTLNVGWNRITSDGAKALAEGLQNCSNLQTLNIGWNHITSDGAKALAEGLKNCSNLQTLNLRMNCIACDGAKSLAEGLQKCKNLRTVNLEWNAIYSDGCKALSSLLQCENLRI